MVDPRVPAERHFAFDAALIAASRTVPILVPLVFTPAVLGVFGRETYALWAILMTTISVLQNADIGVTAIMQRFHSRYRGLGDDDSARRLTSTVLLALGVVAVIIGVLGPFLARVVVQLLRLDGAVAAHALELLGPAGWFAGLQLIGLALTGYLIGQARFVAAALSSLGARAGLAIGLSLTIALGWGVNGLVFSSGADAVLAVILAAAASWPHLRRAFRTFLNRSELREVWSFGWRSQLSTAGFLAQRELDVVLATLFLPLSAIASIAAAAQSAIALALFPTVFLVPAVTRIAHAAAQSPHHANDMIEWVGQTWARLYPVYAAVVVGTIAAAVGAWVGPGLPESPLLATIIAAGMIAFLPSSAVTLSARAIGSPGIETSGYLALVIAKLVVGIAGAIVFGAVGLAASTVIASLAGDVVIAVRGRSVDAALRLRLPPRRTWLAALSALLTSLLGSVLITDFVPVLGLRLIVLGVWAVVVLGAGILLARGKHPPSL